MQTLVFPSDAAQINTFPPLKVVVLRVTSPSYSPFAAVESRSCLRVEGLQYECRHAQLRHVQINMYDSTAVWVSCFVC